MRHKGTDKLATLKISNVNNKAGQLLYALVIESSTLGERLPILSSVFDKIEFNSLNFRVVSKTSTNTTGGYIMGIDSDPSDLYNSGTNLPDKVAALRNSVSASIWETTQISHTEMPKEKFFTELLANGRSVAGTAEIRQASPGLFVIALDADVVPACVLNVYCDWDVTLSEPSLPESNSPPPTPPPVPSQYTFTAEVDHSYAAAVADPAVPLGFIQHQFAAPVFTTAETLPSSIPDGDYPVSRSTAALPNIILWLKNEDGSQQNNVALLCRVIHYQDGIPTAWTVTELDGSAFIPANHANGSFTAWTRIEGSFLNKGDTYLINPSTFAFDGTLFSPPWVPVKLPNTVTTFGVVHNPCYAINTIRESRFTQLTQATNAASQSTTFGRMQEAMRTLVLGSAV
jgi:hypothetical protein